MKLILSCTVVLTVILTGISAQAQVEPLVLYDNFNTGRINPDKWYGGEWGGAGREVVRKILDGRLLMIDQFYGDTNSDSGARVDDLYLDFTNPTVATAIEAKVMVANYQLIGCDINPLVGSFRASLRGNFFNTGTPTPGSNLNDVLALIQIGRLSNSTDPKNILRVQSAVVLCGDDTCSTFTLLDLQDLGPIKLGKSARLRIQWDQVNHQFIFQRDGGPEVFSVYTVSDTNPPGLLNKGLHILANVANCTAETRPSAFIKAFFDNVKVNSSAVP